METTNLPSGDGDGTVDEPASGTIESKLEICQQILDYRFNNLKLLRSALTHASGASHRLASNERLEFLGDAVLGLTVCGWLYDNYPQYSEGDLTKVKSAVVSRRSCGKIACRMGLDQCLIVGRGVMRNRSFPKSLVSDVFESVIAAVYLDGGLDAIGPRLIEWLEDELNAAIESQGSGNFKSSLQQIAQRDHSATPSYRLVDQSGPDHHKQFHVAAIVGPRQFQGAWGGNKKDAEQRAAANALAELRDEDPPFTIQKTEQKKLAAEDRKASRGLSVQESEPSEESEIFAEEDSPSGESSSQENGNRLPTFGEGLY